jgi:hypothetical protein
MKSRVRQRPDLMPPSAGEFREAVQENDERPALVARSDVMESHARGDLGEARLPQA